jgi:hypothetical protein
MPFKRRVHKLREVQISPEAVALFERGIKLTQRTRSEEVDRELSDISFELARALGLKPWNDCPLVDCEHKDPPSFLHDGPEVDDWQRSRGIRLELEAALRERRRAARGLPPAA